MNKKINLAYKNIINKNGWILPYETLKNVVDEFNKNKAELIIFEDYIADISNMNSVIVGKVNKITLIKDGISTADITLNNDIDLNNKELFMCYKCKVKKISNQDESKNYRECYDIALKYCAIKDKKLSCYNKQ